MQDVYLAAILHSGDKLEYLYTFSKKADAIACMNDYCHAKGYSADTGHVQKLLVLDIRNRYDPEEHTVGLMVVRGLTGDWSTGKHVSFDD